MPSTLTRAGKATERVAAELAPISEELFEVSTADPDGRRSHAAACLLDTAGTLLDAAAAVTTGTRTLSEDELALVYVASLVFGPRHYLDAAKSDRDWLDMIVRALRATTA